MPAVTVRVSDLLKLGRESSVDGAKIHPCLLDDLRFGTGLLFLGGLGKDDGQTSFQVPIYELIVSTPVGYDGKTERYQCGSGGTTVRDCRPLKRIMTVDPGRGCQY